MRILKPSDIRKDIVAFFRSESLVPIVGAGLSCNVPTLRGKVPSGTTYKEHMLQALLKNSQFTPEEHDQLKSEKFSTLCDYYEDDENVSAEERLSYLKENFFNAKFDAMDMRRKFFEIQWPYIYSLNIDDAIENSSQYNTIILPNREFRDDLFTEERCLIKLHGDIREIVSYKQSDKIFTSKEYALSLNKNTPLLNKLKNDYANQNILFVGCSLDDEVDLKTLKDASVDFQLKDTLSKTIIFTKGVPGKLQKSKFKTYGITDVVCFETFDSIYKFLYEVWEESTSIPNDELSNYCNVAMRTLKVSDKEKNQNYFFWGKSLFDPGKSELCYPYYFISRDVTADIVKNISKNKLHLVYGNRISGKSYLLADLCRTIRDREVYLFDGRSRISDDSLNYLLGHTDSVALFDVGSIRREQFEKILLSARDINKNRNNFIICVNINDSDSLGIIKWKLRLDTQLSDYIKKYTIKNKLSTDNEIPAINELLPAINLPTYNNKRTLLDQLVYVEKILKKRGQYSNIKIKIDNEKQLALPIMLAVKEHLYSSDVVNFALDEEISVSVKRYAPFIERSETALFEKDPSDLSRIKYSLNSKYWLQRELGTYARVEGCKESVAGAYRYIIQKILDFSGSNLFLRRRLSRNFIMFDVMNGTFLDEHGGNLSIIVYIYTKLHEYLATDYHFLHQEAKCYMYYSYSLDDTESKKKYLNDAKQLALVSKSMIENQNETSPNERLMISIAHVQYTIATILSDLSRINEFTDEVLLKESIDAVYEALKSPYNDDDYLRERKQRASRGVVNFLKYFTTNTGRMKEYPDYHQKVSDLVNIYLTGKQLKSRS